MLTRLLLGGLVAVTAIFVISAVIAAMAPFIAVGIVLLLAWKLKPPSVREDNSQTTGQTIVVSAQKKSPR